MSSLKNKTVSGLIWSLSDLFAKQGIQFIVQIILARLLLPEDFGIIGMITVFIAISNSIINSGFSQALIREKNPTQEDYSTVFYYNLAVSILLYIILYSSAGFISNFFREPQLVSIIRVISLVIIINSFGLIQRTMLEKQIDFKTLTKVSFISSVLTGIIAVLFAFLGFGVWALVFQMLAMQFFIALFLMLNNRWLPSLVFSFDSFKRLFGFGWKLLVSGLLAQLYQNLYYLIIGRFFSATELGYYTNARRLKDMPSVAITSAIQKVSYPVLSSINDENVRLKSGFKKIIKNSIFITFPIMLGLSAIAEPLITFLFGNNWIPSIPYFQILCLAGMLYPLHAINLNILQVKGRSDLFLKLEIIKKIMGLTSIVIVLFLNLGIIGLLWALVINSYLGYLINSYYSAKLLDYNVIEQIKDISKMFVSSIFMAIVVYVIGLSIDFNSFITLLIQIPFGIIVYILLSKIFKIEELNTMKEIIKPYIRKIKRN